MQRVFYFYFGMVLIIIFFKLLFPLIRILLVNIMLITCMHDGFPLWKSEFDEAKISNLIVNIQKFLTLRGVFIELESSSDYFIWFYRKIHWSWLLWWWFDHRQNPFEDKSNPHNGLWWMILSKDVRGELSHTIECDKWFPMMDL